MCIRDRALAGATPVVATDVGGVAFVVQDGVTGLLAPKGDPAAISAQLTKTLEDRQKSGLMAAAGQRDVLERFSHHRLLRDIRALYQALVG